MSNLERQLAERFGFPAFRIGQEDVIRNFLEGRDVLAVLPTGTGKSILYQFPKPYYSGAVVIVSPLVSLMMDQVEQLRLKGVKRVVALTSFQSVGERKNTLRNLHTFDYVFVSPEVMQTEQVKHALKSLHIGYFVFDEAHCLTQWGYDFRPDYLRAAEWIHKEFNKPLLALTATASPQARQDIKNLLKKPDMVEVVRSVDRPTIAVESIVVDSESSREKEIVQQITTLSGPGILYTQSRKKAVYYAAQLRKKGIRAAAYHGGMETMDRTLIQQQFSLGQLDWVCATNAFGMGIHKEDIRQVIHDHIPTSVSNYLQEIGRASRDGKQSFATLYYHPDDVSKSVYIATSDIPDEQDIQMFREMEIGEQKQRILDYWKTKLDDKQLVELFEGIRNTKQRDIYSLYNLLTSSRCIRSSLVEAFGESLSERPEICCSNCTNTLLAKQSLKLKDPSQIDNSKSDYSTRLAQLFP